MYLKRQNHFIIWNEESIYMKPRENKMRDRSKERSSMHLDIRKWAWLALDLV
jgi:hypothetical protein